MKNIEDIFVSIICGLVLLLMTFSFVLIMIIKSPYIVIDERTTRMLCENPENLRKLLQKKLHTSVTANKDNYSYFKNFKIIRSTELAYIAYKKKLFNLKSSDILEAMLYGLKYNGCSISEEEVKQIAKMQ